MTTANATALDSPQARIVQTIRMFMAVNGTEQGDLAELLHVDKSAISRMLKGGRRMTVDELAVIADYFDRPVGDFYAGPDALIRSRCFPTLTLVSTNPDQLELPLDVVDPPALRVVAPVGA